MARNECSTCDGTKDVRAMQCMRCQRTMRPNRRGTGAVRYVMTNGYVVVRVNDRPVYEHRRKMERKLGRKLRRGEHVHHKNGNKQDNRLANLELLSAGEHHRQHMLGGLAKRMSRLGHAARWGA